MGYKGGWRWAAFLLVSGLVCWAATASAQDVPVPGPMYPANNTNGLNSASQNPTNTFQPQQIGVIPQPTIASPGLVTGFLLGELYTNNLTLTPPGSSHESDFITEVQPFLKSAYSSPRFSGLLDYSLTGYLYHQHSNENQLNHNLSAQGTFTLVPQHFYLDGTALYNQQIINNAAPSGSGAYFLTNNRANTAIGVLSPYWIQDLGNAGVASLRYSRGRVAYNTHGIGSGGSSAALSGIPDITSNAVQFSWVSPKDTTVGWNLNYFNQRITPDFGPGAQYASAILGGSYRLNFNTTLLADIGKENKYLPDGTVQTLGARFWDVGFEWTSTLNDVKMMAGHRFYGHSYLVSWTHTAALVTTTLSYTEQPTDYNQQLLAQNPGAMLSSPIAVPQIPSLSERQVYLSKRAAASVSYTTPKSVLTVMLYDELRTFFILNSSQERVANAEISWLFNIGVFTALTPTFGWQRYQYQNGQINYSTYEQLALVHQFSPYDTGSFSVRNGSRNVYFGLPGNTGYRVNILFLQWTHLF